SRVEIAEKPTFAQMGYLDSTTLAGNFFFKNHLNDLGAVAVANVSKCLLLFSLHQGYILPPLVNSFLEITLTFAQRLVEKLSPSL
ncbi:MAG: hypothetical protein V7L04_21515, partial [Nostoc sp.]|uniref:hypothetical protein n=1 Tax=Nostoc sp. TaxID=1180 RepID=UPI002FFB56B5